MPQDASNDTHHGEPSELRDQAARIWATVSGSLADSLPKPAFEAWIAPLRASGLQGHCLYLSAPEQAREWIQRRYSDHLRRALQAQFPQLTEVEIVDRRSRPGADDGDSRRSSDHLNPAYAFERFVIGAGNRFAHSAALHVAESPGEAYNPLFLFGSPGLGKTHLLVAIAHYLRSTRPDLRVHYTTAERFTKEFVTAMRRQGGEAFQERYRAIGALLIDDVQFLEGKPKTEEEFFHTFNALYEAGSQVVLSSDRPPGAHEFLAERLRDRFEWGLSAEVGRPDLRTRMAVLRNIAGRSGGPQPGIDVLREIASRTPDNLRQLEGALTRVTAFTSLIGQTPDPSMAAKIVESVRPGQVDDLPPMPLAGSQPSILQIQQAVSAVLHIRREDLLSSRRTTDLVRGRHLAIYLSRDLTSHSLAEIAEGFNRDHSTIVHAVASIRRKLATDASLRAGVEKVRLLLTNDDQAPCER